MQKDWLIVQCSTLIFSTKILSLLVFIWNVILTNIWVKPFRLQKSSKSYSLRSSEGHLVFFIKGWSMGFLKAKSLNRSCYRFEQLLDWCCRLYVRGCRYRSCETGWCGTMLLELSSLSLTSQTRGKTSRSLVQRPHPPSPLSSTLNSTQ